ncbi:hypothetical protein [uncultured Methylobacterium sp.]|uniref:hypothetical protein n=1 Tax=uncultured Methylobacterium sp. TaxID=157278 RepID=UPI002605D2E3|nr:hypothetical protein [uncultured Methylobacterium sp.]
MTGSSAGPAAPRRGEAGRHAARDRARRYLHDLAPALDAITAEVGRGSGGIALRLTEAGIRKPRGGTIWTSADVRKLQRRLAAERRG